MRMKKRNKVIAILMAAAMLATTGCGGLGVQEVEKMDSNKTQLYIGTMDGGIGDEWLKDAIERFEEKYADTSFEEGKEGVQVIIAENNRTNMLGTTLIDVITSSETEVFFTENVYYYEWVKKNRMYDITDMVNEKLTDYGEDRSIADKLDDALLENLTVDGKIYAIPFWMGSYGLVYNATLFDENKWYYAEDGSFTDAKGKLASGPDGKAGTYDDGLPATYDQFFALLDEINRDNVTPIQWAGASPDYFSWFLGSLAADYEGYDNFMLNYTLDGTANLVKKDTINADNVTWETEQVAITPSNGYELARQGGLLSALNFGQRILRGMGYYYDANTALSGSYKQQDAQIAFVRNTSGTSNKPVAMIIDGDWWENEASVAFESTYGTGSTKFDSECEYKSMPLPKKDESKIGSENVWVSPLESYCFLNPSIKAEKAELALKFLQFCHTDESLTKFTSITGILKPYDYEIDESELTAYSKSVLDITQNSKVLYPRSNSTLYTYQPGGFNVASLFTSTRDEGTNSWNVVSAFTQKDGNNYAYDYVKYFNGIMSYRRDYLWPTFQSVLTTDGI